jgi:uncharacterized protein (TIGR02265 family)
VADEVVFTQTVEGLFRALGGLLDEPAKAKFRALGVDPDQRLMPAYPLALWVQMVELAAEIHAPQAPFEQAVEQLGRRFVNGYAQTLVGKALFTMMRILGPRRTLERMAKNFSTGANYAKTSLQETSVGVFELSLNRVTWPPWYCGMISAGLEAAGAKKVSVEVLEHQGRSQPARFKVWWT